jgi:DNA-binding PadR family transcriptional regulator
MRSEVNWALLGLVIARPSYGLELAHRFERTYGDVLRLSSGSHVYAALDALEARGLIELVPGTELGRQPKPHYRATTLGVQSYEDWVVEKIETEMREQELWVRQLDVFAHDPEVAIHLLGRFEEAYLKMAGQVGRSRNSASGSRAKLIEDLVAEHQRIAVGGKLSWLQSTRGRFDAIARHRAE